MTVEALSDGRAQAYYCHTESLYPATVDRALDMLSREEQERHNHFFRDRDRRDYGAAHVLLRVALAAHTNTTPEQVAFSMGSSGKPCLVSPRGDTARLSFSLSHTPGLVACVIGTENALGIDVEAIDRSIRALEIARDVFSPDEAAALQDCSIEERPLRFFELWTLKEAFLKASGAGLAGMLHCASFAVQGHHVRVRQPLPPGSEEWTFQLMELEATYKLAIAIGSPAGRRPPAGVTRADTLAVMNGVLVPFSS